MTQQTLSNEFTKIYPKVKLYATKAAQALNTPADLSAILSECYIHLDKVRDQISTPQELEAFSKNWIRCNLTWYLSPLHKVYRVQVLEHTAETHSQDLTQLEDLYEKAVLSFTSSLSSYERRLWSMYVEKNLVKGKDLARHLDVSNSTGYQILRECKVLMQKFREHVKAQF